MSSTSPSSISLSSLPSLPLPILLYSKALIHDKLPKHISIRHRPHCSSPISISPSPPSPTLLSSFLSCLLLLLFPRGEILAIMRERERRTHQRRRRVSPNFEAPNHFITYVNISLHPQSSSKVIVGGLVGTDALPVDGEFPLTFLFSKSSYHCGEPSRVLKRLLSSF